MSQPVELRKCYFDMLLIHVFKFFFMNFKEQNQKHISYRQTVESK